MTRDNGRPTTLPASFGLLRLRLTAWYVGTFFAILVVLGVGLFVTITRRFDLELDASLREDTREIIRVSMARAAAARENTETLVDSREELRIPERTLMVLDTLGWSVTGKEQPMPWVRQLAIDAKHAPTSRTHEEAPERILRAHAEPFLLTPGRPLIAVAVADEIELEDRYASFIAAFGAFALVALVLVAVGGWLLARQTTEPVERAITHMRRFMADAAHELRTPLAVVRSRAEVALQRERAPGDYATALQSIERETARLGHIVEDLLTLARADAGERPIERTRMFLDDVALDAADAARVIADRRSVRLVVDEFEEAPVVGDATLLRQLVLILLDNAIKFTAGGGEVRVAIRLRPSGAELMVSDTGVGIPAEQLPHVFERFYRGDPSRTRGPRREDGSFDGAGLGLSIAQWVAQEHGATISIVSPEGEGTRVTVHFPSAMPATLGIPNLSSP